MRMQRRKFRIGELARQLGVERFVVRFWEKEFGIRTTRSEGGQRFFDEKDLEKFKLIKELLYERGFTISGAKQEISRLVPAKGSSKIIASSKTTISKDELNIGNASYDDLMAEREELLEQISVLKNQLMKVRNLI